MTPEELKEHKIAAEKAYVAKREAASRAILTKMGAFLVMVIGFVIYHNHL